MPYTHYERLSGVDAAMLALEDANTHMHVGAVAIFDAAPLMTPEGALEIQGIRSAIDVATVRTPRFRQKLARIPVFGHPVWVDDPLFNLFYHVRHTALPPPGNVRQLKRLTGRLMSQKLDPSKPQWEAWVVEGLEGDRFALILKAHHCMVDGVAGIDLLSKVMRPDADPSPPSAPRWISRPAPSDRELIADELVRRAALPLSLASAGWRGLREPRGSLEALRRGASTLLNSFFSTGGLVSPTPLDDETGPYRRVDWLQLDLQAALDARRAADATLNDLVLACAAGAFGRFLLQRGLRPADLEFRTSVPVNTRGKDIDPGLGNHVSTLTAPLPIDEPDPLKRLAKVVETTRELKESMSKEDWGALDELSDNVFPLLMGAMLKLASTRLRFVNVYVSNIPGPRVPVYLLGAPMLEIYPVAPVAHSLAVAVFSYDKGLYWGFNADWDKFPDLHDLIEFTRDEFERTLEASAARTASLSS
jgi:WS/DGAT/MGAT family acyltransferase